MSTATRPMTAAEFMAADLGEGLHELVKGEVVELPNPRPEHGKICVNASFALEGFGRRTGHGYALSNDSAVQTEHGPDTIRGADVCYYSEARWPRARVGPGVPPVAPDLVVEVYSPSNRAGEMRRKVYEYLEAGVLLVWVVHPGNRTVAVYRPDEPFPTIYTDADTLEILPELPGFACPVAELFR